MAVLRKKPRTKPEPNRFDLPRGEKIRRKLVAIFEEQRRAIIRSIRGGKAAKETDDGEVASVANPLRDGGRADHGHVRSPGLQAGDPDAVAAKDGGGDLPDLGPLEPDAAEMAARMAPLLELIWEESGRRFNSRIGLDPDAWSVTSPETAQAIEDAALAFCEATNETTSLAIDDAREQVRQALRAGVLDRGETVEQLTDRILAIFDTASTSRARTIAQTEASRARHAAQEAAARKSGVVRGWAWLLSSDACPMCNTIARRCPTVRLGQPFAIIGDDPHYSTIKFPPAHPRCNCTVVEVLDTDEEPQWSGTLVQPVPEDVDTDEPNVTPFKPVEKPVGRPKPAPKPRSARRQKPKPVPESGESIGEKLDIPPSMTGLRGVVGVIDKVHRIEGVEGVMGVRFMVNMKALGQYFVGGDRIYLREDGPTLKSTLVHEIGHWLNERLLKIAGGKTDYSGEPELAGWLKAVRATRAFEALRILRATMTEKNPYLDYVMQDDELWARSYTQWVTKKSGDEALTRDLEHDRGRSLPLAWTDDDFEPVARALDDIFRKRGLLK